MTEEEETTLDARGDTGVQDRFPPTAPGMMDTLLLQHHDEIVVGGW